MPARMVGRIRWVAAWIVVGPMIARAEEPTVVGGLKRPESVVVGPEGKVYVTVIGESDKDGDGGVVVVDPSGKVTPFASGMDDPKGMVVVGEALFVADKLKVWRVDASGKAEVYIAPEAFPRKPLFLNDLAADGQGNLFVSDSGDRAGKKGAVFRISNKKEVTLVLDAELTSPPIEMPNGVYVDDATHLFVADMRTGYLYRYDLASSTAQRIAGGFGGPDGIARDARGRLFVSDWRGGRVFLVTSEQAPPALIADKFQAAADIALTPDGKTLLVPDMKAGTLTWFPVP